MTTSIARQSVIIKCNMQCAYILGNYEFYYGAGLAGKLFAFDVPEEIQPEELKELLAEKLSGVEGNTPQETYLISLLQEFIPEKRYDEQMKELLIWGQKEEQLWQVQI